MDRKKEWQNRIRVWMNELPNHLFRPILSVPLSYATTYDTLSPGQALALPYAPAPEGLCWGAKWQYGWFQGEAKLPASAAGKRIVLRTDPGGECLVYINGEAAGAKDREHREITLSTCAKGNETYSILIESYAGHGPHIEDLGPVPPERPARPAVPDAQVRVGETLVGIWEEDAYQLLMDATALAGLLKCLPPASLRAQKVEKGLRDMTLAVDFELQPDERMASIRRGREILAPLLSCVNGSTAPMMHIFGQSHIDLCWQWPMEETKHKIGRTMATQLALLKEYPEAKYLFCEPPLLDMLKAYHPGLHAQVLVGVKDGSILADGGVWTEGDSNIPSGECLIRQVLEGRKAFKAQLGTDSRLVWQPDVFGFPAQLPQIYIGCGMKYFTTQKLYNTYGGGDPFPYNVFQWQGLDGTKILSCLYRRNNAPFTVEEITNRWEKDRLQQDFLDSMMFPFGYGDGGGGPTRDQLELSRRIANLEGMPKTCWSSPSAYMEHAQTLGEAPVYIGELYYQAHRGTFTSQARTKKGNRLAEDAMRSMDLWTAFAQVSGGTQGFHEERHNLWRKLLMNQFHDILPGTSIERVHQEAEQAFSQIKADADRITGQQFQSLLLQGEGLTVFNSLSCQRQEVIALPEGFHGASDEHGPLPVQQIDGKSFALVTAPPMGAACILPSSMKTEEASILSTFHPEPVLENDRLRAVFDNFGRITSLYDKEKGMELSSGPMNAFKLYKDVPSNYDAWDIDSMYALLPIPIEEPAELSEVVSGPLLTTMSIRRKLHNSTMTQHVSLQAGTKTLVFQTEIDWHERHALLKVAFPTSIHTENMVSETQFGIISRPTHASRAYDQDRFEVCQHRFSALMDRGAGLAVLNDCKYGISAQGNCMRLTLLKSALAPDEHADQGMQSFAYALMPFAGEAGLPSVLSAAQCMKSPIRAEKGSIKPFSMVQTMAGNIIIESVKTREDKKSGLVLRIYEALGKTTQTDLLFGFPAQSAAQTDMAEEIIQARYLVQDSKMTLCFRPFEIKTLVIS